MCNLVDFFDIKIFVIGDGIYIDIVGVMGEDIDVLFIIGGFVVVEMKIDW